MLFYIRASTQHGGIHIIYKPLCNKRSRGVGLQERAPRGMSRKEGGREGAWREAARATTTVPVLCGRSCRSSRQSDLKIKPYWSAVVWTLRAHEVKKGLFFASCDFATNDADINNHAQTETQFPHRLQMEGEVALETGRLVTQLICLGMGKASSAHNVHEM